MNLQLRRTGNGMYLAPYSELDQEVIEKLPKEQVLIGNFKKSRNPDHHRKFWALVNTIAENSDLSDHKVLVELKIAAGHYDEYITSDGEIVFVPRSIAFDNMDQFEFEPFYDKCLDIAADKFGITDFE